VASYVGAQFGSVGFSLDASGLAPGGYQIVAYGRSLVTGTFAAVAAVVVTVR
jgi:hypothetical protein